jgi:AcrR family transcriptional regulator
MAKKIFTKEVILKAAYELALEKGIDKISMRNLADKIGCSVMPIYAEFITKQELIRAISTFTEQMSDKDSLTLYDRYHRLLYYGLKYTKFFLSVVNYDAENFQTEEVITNLCELLKKDSRLAKLTNFEVYEINARIEIYIVGIVYMYSNTHNVLDRYERFKTILDQTVDAMIEGYINTLKK